MITWLVGENSFAVREALQQFIANFNGTPERIDSADVSLAKLPDLLMGMQLFATERLVIISDISQNKAVWEKLPDWLSRIDESIHLVLVDTKPDKRTTSYKALKAAATIQEFPLWGDRDAHLAEQWVSARAKAQQLPLDTQSVRHLVQRVGLDQWQLAKALDTIALLDDITPQAIDDIIPANLSENIFQLFEVALEGNTVKLAKVLRTLEQQEDPFSTFALLTSQALTLAAVTFAPGDAQPTKDFGIHPFVAGKLERHGKKLGQAKVARITALFAQTDADMKRSKAEPWLLIERTLVSTAQLA